MAADHPIVGVWQVHAPYAPFEHHMMTFHADGTLLQANPDAARRRVSDSVGMGLWCPDPNRPDTIRGRFVEVSVHRDTGEFAGRTSVTVQLTVHHDCLEGFAETTSDTAAQALRHTTLTGTRIRL